ncbi:MAG: hypothetical protein KA981_02795 [Bacteroidia bacterium]|nr:hypothetical protein [Bacteroidia bacterium]
MTMDTSVFISSAEELSAFSQPLGDKYKLAQLIVACCGVFVAFFVLFFRTWWEDREKQNKEIEDDNIRALLLSSLLFLSNKATTKIKDAYAAMYKDYQKDPEKFPERQIVILKASIERLIQLPNIESYLNSFNKVYNERSTEGESKSEITIFNDMIVSFEWVSRYDDLFDVDIKLYYEKYNELYDQISVLKRSINTSITKISVNHKNNVSITQDLNKILDSKQTLNTTGDLIFKMYFRIMNSEFIKLISISERIDLVSAILEIETCYNKLIRITESMFSKLPKIIRDLEAIEAYSKEILLELNISIEKYKKPVRGGFLFKLEYYLNNPIV